MTRVRHDAEELDNFVEIPTTFLRHYLDRA